MSYPRNAASPEPVAIGPVIQISDGAVQTSGVTVRIKPTGVSEADGGGTTSYSTDGIVYYTPTQAETDYTSFILIAKKTGCIPASVTVVTSASATAGKVVLSGETHTAAVIPTVSTVTDGAKSATALSTAQWTNTLATNLGTTNTMVATNLDATVSSRLASASYSSPPSAAAISSQVASDLAAAHGAGSWATATGFSTHSAADVWTVTTRGLTEAVALDSAARSALLQAMVTEDTGETVAADGSVAKLAQGSASGLTEDQANQLDSIQAHTNLITSGTRVRVTADGGQTIELKIGDDFSAANGTAKRIEVNDADSAIYDALTDETLTAREFGVGIEGSPDLVTGTFEADTITHTPASGSVPAYTTIFVECSVSESLQSITAGYDIQITDSDGRKRTPFSGVCDLVTNYKS